MFGEAGLVDAVGGRSRPARGVLIKRKLAPGSRISTHDDWHILASHHQRHVRAWRWDGVTADGKRVGLSIDVSVLQVVINM